MKKFNEFNITLERKSFQGDKIKIDRLLNREITVEAFKVEKSKFEGKGDCLHLQIKLNDELHVVFVSSPGLIEMIKQVPEMPFLTTIVRENNCLKFT